MCGLPGAGKTSLSRELARGLGALRWDKDELRELLFPAMRIQHGRPLNDFCMELLYAGVQYAFGHASVPIVIFDGRPFLESAQRARVREVAKQAGVPVAFVVCEAPMTVARMHAFAGSIFVPPRSTRSRIAAASCGPRSPKSLAWRR